MPRYAITFGEVAILHVGGAQVGTERSHGFSVPDLQAAKAKVESTGGSAEIFMLSRALPEELQTPGNSAATLVIRNGAALFLNAADAADLLLAEQKHQVSYDASYWDRRRGRTLCKRARYNVVFGERGREASQDFKDFTIKAFSELPLLSALRSALPQWFGDFAVGLNAEGNLYYDAACGIGFHGDSERKIVMCLSLGASSVLRYHWRLPLSSEHTLEPVDIELRHGDIYVMSEKATGCDWRSRSRVRLVHAAGAQQYIGQPRSALPRAESKVAEDGGAKRQRVR